VRFRLSANTHAKVIPVTKASRQLHPVVAAEQRANREASEAKKANGNRQQYLAFVARRDRIILDAADDLARTLTAQELQQLKQRANREAIEGKKANGNRQQYLAFLARRDRIILDAVDDLARTLTAQEFQQLKQRVYSEYGPK